MRAWWVHKNHNQGAWIDSAINFGKYHTGGKNNRFIVLNTK